jgi:C-terminal processing protease CtpA/Prc
VQTARDAVHHTVEERCAVGLLAQDDGTIIDVVRDSPAWKAGLGPGMKIEIVDRREWSPNVLRETIAADRNTTVPINSRCDTVR